MEDNDRKSCLINDNTPTIIFSSYTDENYFNYLAKEREREIENTSNSIYKINDIFQDLANLVDCQQENFNDIENQIISSNKNTQNSVFELTKANRNYTLNNKCKCYSLIFIIFTIILLIFIFFIIK